MTKQTLRAFYRPHKRISFTVEGPSMTKQAHKQECDINFILKQYQRTGIITHVQAARPTYTDLPSDFDFQQSLNTLMAAEAAFDALPAVVRRHFDNDPAAFLAAFSDPAQQDQLRDWGFFGSPTPPDHLPTSPAPQPSGET